MEYSLLSFNILTVFPIRHLYRLPQCSFRQRYNLHYLHCHFYISHRHFFRRFHRFDYSRLFVQLDIQKMFSSYKLKLFGH